MPGVTWNSCCSPCRHGARRATHCMWSAFIFHGQVQTIICPFEISGKPPPEQPHPCRGFLLLRTCKTPNRHWAHPFKEGIVEAPPTRLQMLYIGLNLQENQRLIAHHRTQPLDTVLNLHHRTSLNLHHTSQDTAFTAYCSTKSTSQDTTFTVYCSKYRTQPLL